MYVKVKNIRTFSMFCFFFYFHENSSFEFKIVRNKIKNNYRAC